MKRNDGRELFGPGPVAAVAVLLLNDHVLKRTVPGFVTGKLSDFAICFFLPLLIAALLGALGLSPRARLATGAILGAVVFTALELSDAAAGAFQAVFGPAVFTRDLGDLAALAMVPAAYVYGRARHALAHAPTWPPVARAATMGAALLALGATSPPPKCLSWTAPVTFKVEGDCGPSGLIVVQGDEYDGYVIVRNGLPLLGVDGGRYDGDACPYRFAEGGWSLGDEAHRSCTAALENGDLWLTCAQPNGGARCRSRLTLVVDP